MENSSFKKYPPMDRLNRAKQFMPFDALRGFREALAEKERIIEMAGEHKGEPERTLKTNIIDF